MSRFQTETPVTSDGQEVRGELDPVPGAADGAGDRLGERGLADAGDVLDEEVPGREQADEREVDRFALALDHPLDVVDQGPEERLDHGGDGRRRRWLGLGRFTASADSVRVVPPQPLPVVGLSADECASVRDRSRVPVRGDRPEYAVRRS